MNNITKKDAYHLPMLDEILDDMAGSSAFFKHDLQKGCHKIQILADNVMKTAFQTQFGSFQSKAMSFGLCNAPATFQMTMNILLSECRALARVYIDDVVFFSQNIDEHWEHVRILLDKLGEKNLYAKRKKCLFAQPEIEFCGFLVNYTWIHFHPENVEAISNWPTPKSVNEVRSFICLVGFYQRFVNIIADIAAPLTALFKKCAQLERSDIHRSAFAELKPAWCSRSTFTFRNCIIHFICT